MDNSSLQLVSEVLAKKKKLVSEVGNRIRQQPLPSKDFLVKNLKLAVSGLSQLEQPSVIQADAVKVNEALEPLRNAIIKHSLALHKDKDVKLLIAICVTEIFRLWAPEVPFEDESLKGIFGLLISMFSELADTSSSYFPKRVKILETFSRCKCCVVMLDAGCSDLILKMFNTFFSAVREQHHQSLIDDVLSIMTQIINEEASQQLVEVILQSLLKEKKGTPSASSRLAFSVIQACSEKLRPFICGFLTSCILDRDVEGSELRECYHQIIYRVFICSPQMLSPIIPNLVQELLADQVDVRLKAVNLFGKIFVAPEGRAVQEYRLLFVEFLKRFSDKSVEVRKNCLKLIKDIYMANQYGSEVRELLLALECRMLDIDDRVRIQAVTTACELARCNIKRTPPELISQVIERLRDRKATVRKEALKKLMEVYRDYCSKCSVGHMTTDTLFEKIPCEVLMLYYAKDCKEFRSHHMELLLAEELFPVLSPSEQTMHWIHMFSLFKPLHIKALGSILFQKQRFQMELQHYLALRKKDKEVNGSDERVKRVSIFRKLSASFPIPGKAEEWFDKLDQLKDNHIFDALDQSLGEMTFVNSDAEKDKFIKMMRDRHPDFELVRAVGLKCAYNIFGMEHVKYILNQLSGDKFGSTDLEISSAQLLLAIVGYCPYLLKGSEKKLCMLLEKNDLVRDKLVEVLAKAGSLISVKLSDIFHVLKMMCLEGTRKQSKVAVSAIAAIMGSSSDETTVSELCKQLVDRLCEGKNIPTVLQSLGCIAQHSVAEDADVYGQIMPLILNKIFKMIPSDYLISSIDTCDCSNLCTLKICALKALVKSFRPHQETDSNDPLLGILLKILQTGNTSDLVSSEDDRDHMRLAAAKSVLRLSRRWDLHIAPETFCCTVLMAKDPFFSFRRSFIGKTFKLLKEHNIPSRYACALALAASDSNKDIQKESSKYLSEFIQEYNKDARTRRASSLGGGSMIYSPVYTVVFLIYVLAHDPDFPSKEYWDEQTFANFCRPLFCLMEALVNEDNVNGDPDLVTETFSYLFGLLRAIGKAEDAVDAESTSNLHILSELGSAFAASLRKGNMSSRRAPSVVLLPSHFYRASAGSKDLALFTLGEGFIKRTIETFDPEITEPTSILSENSRKNKPSCELPENKKQRSAKHITNGQLDSLTAKTYGVRNATTQAATMTQKRKRVPSDESAENLSTTLPRQKRDTTVLGKEKLLSSCNNVNKVNSLTEPCAESCNVERNDGCLKENAEMGSGLTAECSAGSRAEAPDRCCKETHGIVDLQVGEQNKLIPSSDGSFVSGSADGISPLKDTHKALDNSEDNRTVRLETETESLDTLSTDSLTDGLIFAAKKPNRVNLQQKVLRDLASIGNMEPTGSNEDSSKSQIQGGKKGNSRRSSSKSSLTEVTNKNDNVVLRRSQRRRG